MPAAAKKKSAPAVKGKKTVKKTIIKKAMVKKAVPASAPAQELGKPAPSFSMAATKVGKVSNALLKGKPYILYFYPKDDTPGCTVEACDFRDALPNFSKLRVAVIGVSRDNLASHEKFAKKFQLTFPLAYDETGMVCEKFGVWKEKSMYGRVYMGIERSTFLVDGKGIIRGVWRKVNVPEHVAEVKKAIAKL